MKRIPYATLLSSTFSFGSGVWASGGAVADLLIAALQKRKNGIEHLSGFVSMSSNAVRGSEPQEVRRQLLTYSFATQGRSNRTSMMVNIGDLAAWSSAWRSCPLSDGAPCWPK
jgi:hypothetical protein